MGCLVLVVALLFMNLFVLVDRSQQRRGGGGVVGGGGGKKGLAILVM